MSDHAQPEPGTETDLPPAIPTPWYFIHGPRSLVVDRHVLRHTGFSILSWQAARLRGDPTLRALLLTTIGRRSGRLQEHALSYTWDGDAIVLLGSNSGMSRDPAWALNLRAESRCWVRVDRHDYAARARFTTGKERSRLITDMLPERPHASVYEARIKANGREMPVVLLQFPVGPRPQRSRKLSPTRDRG